MKNLIYADAVIPVLFTYSGHYGHHVKHYTGGVWRARHHGHGASDLVDSDRGFLAPRDRIGVNEIIALVLEATECVARGAQHA